MASRNNKLRDFPEHNTELEHDESDEVGNNFKKEVSFTNELEREEEQQESQENQEQEQEQEEIEEDDGEFESMEHIRKKMATMEAETQQLLSLSRQMNEKISPNNLNLNHNHNHNNNKDNSPNNANKDGPSLNSPNGNSTAANLNPNTVTNVSTAATANNIKAPLSSTDNLDPNVLGGEKEEDQKALDERSIFVKNLGKEVGADQLKEYFESCGAIERITILANKFTGEARGCAYIQFKSKVAVANALLLDGKTWQGKEIEVKTKRTNLPIWMLERGRARGRGGFRGRSSFRGRGRGAFAYRGYRGGYRGRGYWHPYAGY